ncbi:MAG: response regulator [Pseudomonadota bacterium]
MALNYIVADDSLFARYFIKSALKDIDPDAIIHEASSGEKVLEISLNNDIDWYLLDINMEEPDGIKVAKELIDKGVDVAKIALITGNKSNDLMTQAEEMGVAYLQKAIGPNEVVSFVVSLRNFFEGACV